MALDYSSEGKPFDQDAEEAVLGSILINPKNYEEVSAHIKPESFFLGRNKWIFEAFGRLITKQVQIDNLTLASELESMNRLNDIGGNAYITELIKMVPNSLNAAVYAKQVKRNAIRRDVIDLALKMVKDVRNEAKPEDLLFEIEREIGNLREKSLIHKSPDLLTANSILTSEWPDQVWIIPGILPIGLTLFAGKAKVGKSWLALQIALGIGAGEYVLGVKVAPRPVLYLSLEDPPRRLKSRMVIQNWPLNLPVDFLKMGSFENLIGNLNGGGGNRLANLILDKGYGVVIIDTLSRAIYGDQSDVAKMTRALEPVHEIAHKCETAIVMIDHHHKMSGRNKDVIWDILGSTAKGAIADNVWGLYRETSKVYAELKITGRDIVENILKLTWCRESGIWQSDDDEHEIKLSDAEQEVLRALRSKGEARAIDISNTLNKNRGNTQKRLVKLVNLGLASRSTDKEGIFYKASPNESDQLIQN